MKLKPTLITVAATIIGIFFLMIINQPREYTPDCDNYTDYTYSVYCQQKALELKAEREKLAHQQRMRELRHETIASIAFNFRLIMPWLIVLFIILGIMVARILLQGYAMRFTNVATLEHGLYMKEARLSAKRDIGIEQARASALPANAPHTFTYSPRTTGKPTVKELSTAFDTSLSSPNMPELQAFQVRHELPTAQEFLSGNTFALGYNQENQQVESTLCSMSIGGKTGSGKSSVAVGLLAKAVKTHNAKLVIIDPHKDAPQDSLSDQLQPLRNAFLFEPVDKYGADTALNYMAELLERRLKGETGQPVILVIDEALAIVRSEETKKKFLTLGCAIAQEGRKVNVFIWLIAQLFKSSSFDNTDLRDSLPQHLVCRSVPSNASIQTGLPKDEFKDVLQLPKGTFYMLDVAGDKNLLTLPHVQQKDLQGYAPVAMPASPQTQPIGFVDVGKQENTKSLKTQLTPQDARIVQLIKDGLSNRKIIMQLTGKTGGKAYTEMSERIKELREQMG